MPRGKPKKKVVKEKPAKVVAPETASDTEEMSEADADAMFERKANADVKKIDESLAEVDRQDWENKDPIIPASLAGKVWIAVYSCPDDHKTKATNRQRDTGILCWWCKQEGKEVKATIVPVLFDNPPPLPVDDAKRVTKRSPDGR